MSWLLYIVLYLLLAVNGIALLNTLEAIFGDHDLDDTDTVWFIMAGLLTPLNLIWLASL
ncbi:MAG: hypothetical protein ACOVMT_04155 [Caulobacter sp.]